MESITNRGSVKMCLLRVAVYVNTPKLAANHTLPHPLQICMAQQLFGKVKATIVNAVMQLNPQHQRKVIVAIDQAFLCLAYRANQRKNPKRISSYVRRCFEYSPRALRVIGRVDWSLPGP